MLSSVLATNCRGYLIAGTLKFHGNIIPSFHITNVQILTAVTAKVSGHPLLSLVKVGPAVVKVSKSNLKVQISVRSNIRLEQQSLFGISSTYVVYTFSPSMKWYLLIHMIEESLGFECTNSFQQRKYLLNRIQTNSIHQI